MQPLSKIVSFEIQDPFIILKNYRKKYIRPKAKYVRKAPYTRKITKQTLKKDDQKVLSKNERKMTADSDLIIEYRESHLISLTEKPIQFQQKNFFPPKDSRTQQNFFEQLDMLDFILPFESKTISGQQQMLMIQQNDNLVDFFSD